MDRLGLAAEHRRLVRHADALQVEEGIESGTGGAVKAGEEFAGIAAVDHEIGNGLGVLEIEHNQVVTLPVLPQRARGGGAGFLVRSLAVDDRGHSLGGILADALPDTHDIAAGGINNLAAVGFHRVDHGDLGAERRHDHDIFGLEVVEVGVGGVGSERVDAQRLDLGVHIGVVDDFAEEKNPAVFENFARRVGEVDGAFDAVAKAKFLCEADGCISRLEDTALCAEFFDEFAAVVGFHLGLDLGHDLRRADVDAGWGAHDSRGRDFTASRALPRKWLQGFVQKSGMRHSGAAGAGAGSADSMGQRIWRRQPGRQSEVMRRAASSRVRSPVMRYIPVWRFSVSRRGWAIFSPRKTARQFPKAAG